MMDNFDVDYDTVRKNVHELQQYAELVHDEWSEMIGALCMLAGRIDMVSEQLAEAIQEELAYNVEYVRENAKIVTRTETFTRTVYDVEWKDE